MGTPPFVSIITVTLNPGTLLPPTVESVLAQEFTDYEHIIKDGGSTDGSLEFLTALGYATRGQRQLHASGDNGIYDAMNHALQLASGRYVYFLNAGDTLLDRRSLAQVAEVTTSASAPTLVYTDYCTGHRNLVIRNPHRLSPFFLYRTTLNHQCCFFRRDAMLEGGGFDLSYRVLADFEFLVRLAARRDTTVLHVPLPAAYYRAGGFSESASLAGVRHSELRRLRRRHFPLRQRLLFATIWGMTLPRLRLAALRNRHIDRWYTLLRNRIYRRRTS